MKYILIYSYIDVYEKAECEFYLTTYEIPKKEVEIFEDDNTLRLRILELIGKNYKNLTYSAYESKQYI